VCELAPDHGDPPVTVVAGVTAALAGAAVLGAPLGHDHAAVSLSDLLTPWPVIERRLRAVADGDFTVSLYNPRSKRRTGQLDAACLACLEVCPVDAIIPSEEQSPEPPGPPVHPIEEASYRILAERVDLSAWPPGERDVVARMVHATADESFAATTRIGERALEAAVAALAG